MDVFNDPTFAGLIEESRSIMQEPDRTLPELPRVIVLIGQLQVFTRLVVDESFAQPRLSPDNRAFFEGLLRDVLPTFEVASAHMEEVRRQTGLVRLVLRGILARHHCASTGE